MYADDTTLTSSAEDPYIFEHKMNYDMNLIQSWLTANKLTLNIKKTKYMLIGSKFKLSQIHNDFTVKVHNTPLARVVKHKVLGVHIDESLNWRPHINATSKKISAGLAILKRVSPTIPFDTRMNMYNALVVPYFDYCSTVGAISARGYQTKSKNCKIGLPEFLPFQITKVAQVLCWMSLAGKVWKTKDLNNWLWLCIKSIIIFPHCTWSGFLPTHQPYTHAILETQR